MLIIKTGDYESLRRHGEETYPYECCGALLGRFENGGRVVRVVEEAVRCTNVRADRPQDRYQVDDRELIAIQRQADERGLQIVGFYHSHPDHPAQWSKTDLAEAHWMLCSYVITAVEKGTAASTNSFVLSGSSEENKRLEPEEIRVVSLEESQSQCR